MERAPRARISRLDVLLLHASSDYEQELEDHRAFIAANDLELRGRIYINQQGINAQMSGRGTDGETYARWVESRAHFNGMRVSVYPVNEQAHPKLSLRYKPQLVQLEGGTAHSMMTKNRARSTHRARVGTTPRAKRHALEPGGAWRMTACSGEGSPARACCWTCATAYAANDGTSGTSAARRGPCRRASARPWQDERRERWSRRDRRATGYEWAARRRRQIQADHDVLHGRHSV